MNGNQLLNMILNLMEIKRIDKETQRKLYWLFIPMAIVVTIEMAYLWFDVNILDLWFGADIDILTWCKPALLLSVLIVFVGYAIAAIRQRCWLELAIALVIGMIMLLNFGNFFVDLIFNYRN